MCKTWFLSSSNYKLLKLQNLFLVLLAFLCYSTSNNHAYFITFHKSVTPKNYPNKITDAACDHPSSHFRNYNFYRHRHFVVSVACYPVLQPCFQVRPFCNMCTLFSNFLKWSFLYTQTFRCVCSLLSCSSALLPG